MEDFFIHTIGLSSNTFTFIILPLLIFLARVGEVSVNTLRIIYMLGGRRSIATVMGFVEAFIWLIAIRQIFQHIDNWASFIAYPGGFAAGIFVGMIIEERIAYGNVIIRIITRHDMTAIEKYLGTQGFRFTAVLTHGLQGPETLLFVVLARENLDDLIIQIKRSLPEAYYTIEQVMDLEETGLHQIDKGRLSLFTWLRGIIRN